VTDLSAVECAAVALNSTYLLVEIDSMVQSSEYQYWSVFFLLGVEENLYNMLVLRFTRPQKKAFLGYVVLVMSISFCCSD